VKWSDSLCDLSSSQRYILGGNIVDAWYTKLLCLPARYSSPAANTATISVTSRRLESLAAKTVRRFGPLAQSSTLFLENQMKFDEPIQCRAHGPFTPKVGRVLLVTGCFRQPGLTQAT
jgi:hypothetical protein